MVIPTKKRKRCLQFHEKRFDGRLLSQRRNVLQSSKVRSLAADNESTSCQCQSEQHNDQLA